jgi:hypothetical protein
MSTQRLDSSKLTCVILAYKESRHLEACVKSLRGQTVACPLLISTSTPNALIEEIASRYQVPVRVNHLSKGIAADWNFALDQVETAQVTLCHQDDIYLPRFCEEMISLFESTPSLLMAFSDHTESTDDGERPVGLNLKIKRALVKRAFGRSGIVAGRDVRRRLLSWGNPISCPSVVFNRRNLPSFYFDPSWQVNLDWDAWDRICQRQGDIGFIDQVLVSHRVHPASETSASIRDRRRYNEDVLMFKKFWPSWLVNLLMTIYRLSYLSNQTRN